MEELARAHSPYPDRRHRAELLRERYPHAAEVLTLYLALLDVQERAFEATRDRPPQAADVVAHVTTNVLPAVLDVTLSAGPPKLAGAVMGRYHSADLDDLVGRWLRSADQSVVDRYLARASSLPVLEALSTEMLKVACRGPSDARQCPRCRGAPQVSYFALSGEALLTGPRYLICSRCSHSWVHSRMRCAACGETATSRLPVYSEAELLPHLRIDACDACRRYLLTVDLRKDVAAVPVVDELAAIPLDLFAKERGYAKLLPNLMGI
jgi:FdhE protein